MPDPQPVDNLANATVLPEPLPEISQPEGGNCHPFATTFASVHSHPQIESISSLKEDVPAPVRTPARSEQNLPSDLNQLSATRLRFLMDSFAAAEVSAAEAASSGERKRNVDVQKAAVIKRRSMACPLAPEHLAAMRKQAGIGAAA
jgi:hypothetical protein